MVLFIHTKDKMLEKLKKLRQELHNEVIEGRHYVSDCPISDEESVEAMKIALSALDIVRYRGAESVAFKQIQKMLYYDVYAKHNNKTYPDSQINDRPF